MQDVIEQYEFELKWITMWFIVGIVFLMVLIAASVWLDWIVVAILLSVKLGFHVSESKHKADKLFAEFSKQFPTI